MTPAAVFDRIKASLPGRWEGTRPNGARIAVDYRLSACGSALVETWNLKEGVEAMTIYHLDGGTLLATHFCPLGNQPRLKLAHAAGDRFDFVFQDAAGLGPGDKHQRRFWIALGADGTFEREETYGDGVAEESERIEYRRAAHPA